MFRITDTVKHLMIINVLFWVATLLIGSRGVFMTNLFAMHFPLNDAFNIWQVITHMFMHASYDMNGGVVFFHILSNMFALFIFGPTIERKWGKYKFLFFYFSCGIGAVILASGINYYDFMSTANILIENGFTKQEIVEVLNEGKIFTTWPEILDEQQLSSFFSTFSRSSLGASGATMGLTVAFGVLFPNTELMLLFFPVPVKAKYLISLLVAYEIVSGFLGGSSIFGFNVGHWAHVGGALVGFIMAYYWKKNSFNSTRWN